MKTRDTAKNHAKTLLAVFQQNPEIWTKTEDALIDAIQMVERELGGFLSHPESLYRSSFNSVRKTIFPSGLITGEKGVRPGHDLLLALENLDKYKISASIQQQLKNPELGIRNIVGYDLAAQLFLARGELLTKLAQHNHGWQPNADANTRALINLQKHRQLKPSEITLSRHGMLSFFYYSPSPQTIFEENANKPKVL